MRAAAWTKQAIVAALAVIKITVVIAALKARGSDITATFI
jgi:hypothetical protein